MSEHRLEQRNTGCFLNAVIIVLLIVIAFGTFGGAAALEAGTQRQAIIYPDIPAPVPEQLNIVPSLQTFEEPTPRPLAFDPCADLLASSRGWENGVGGQLPPCWALWTREQQNAFLRSH